MSLSSIWLKLILDGEMGETGDSAAATATPAVVTVSFVAEVDGDDVDDDDEAGETMSCGGVAGGWLLSVESSRVQKNFSKTSKPRLTKSTLVRGSNWLFDASKQPRSFMAAHKLFHRTYYTIRINLHLMFKIDFKIPKIWI